jgi:hypothetical protein
MYLVPPMAEEPPVEFVNFVAVHLATMQQEAARLVGGPQHADEIYPMAFSDVAAHWRRLRWRNRLTHRDTRPEFLVRRLTTRARQWREEQIYEVEVQMLRPPSHAGSLPSGHALPASYALRKAELLPGTERVQSRPLAEAAIAWSHAWRRARWHRIGRITAAIVLVLLAFLQALPAPD